MTTQAPEPLQIASENVKMAASSPSEMDQLFDNLIKKNRKNPEYVTDTELARQLSLSVYTIRKWRCQGKIVPYEFGRSVRYAVDEVVAVLTRKGNKHREKQKR